MILMQMLDFMKSLANGAAPGFTLVKVGVSLALKTPHNKSQRAPGSSRRRNLQGMTLIETMVTGAVFSLVVLGVLSTQSFILRCDQLVCSKVGATDMSRMSFDDLTRDVRSAKIWAVGTGSASSFTPVPNGALQLGNALQICLSADTNSFVHYFFDTNACLLYRELSGGTNCQVLARSLTNTMYFQAENYNGAAVTDLQYKYVIHVLMQFCQFQYPLTRVGPGYYYNYYKIEFRISPHCPDGA